MKEEKWYHQKEFGSSNVIAVSKNLLYHLCIPVTNSYLTSSIKNHPNSRTIASISAMLKKLKIRNMTVKITVDELNEIPYPAIAQIKKNDSGYFIMLKCINSNQIKYIDPDVGWVTESKIEFQKKWTGIVLMADAEESIGEQDYKKKRLYEKLTTLKAPFLVVAGIILLGLTISFVIISRSFFIGDWLPLFLIKVAGVAICILLLIKTIDSQNPLVNRICNLGKKKNNINCNSILDSSAAKLFGVISWTEIGSFYFIGSFFTLVFSLFTNSKEVIWWFLAMINLLALPYTVYSIIYQALVAKQWCTLCTAIQLLLWLEFIFLFNTSLFAELPDFNLLVINVIAWGFLLPLIFWVVVKQGLVQSKAVQPLQDRLKKFLMNPKLLNKLLVNGKKMEPGVFTNDIIIGNPESKTVVTLVISMYCGPCATAFKQMNALVKESGNFCVVIRFSAKSEDNDLNTNNIVKFILAATFEKNTNEVIELIKDWYEKGNWDFNSWMKKNPLSSQETLTKAIPILEAHINWCKKAVIQKTPTIFINNYEIPEGFSSADIPYFLELY